MTYFYRPRSFITLALGCAVFGLAACGAYDTTARAPEAGPALDLEQVMDQAMSRIKNDPALMQVALKSAEDPNDHAAAILRQTLAQVQAATGRSDPAALHTASQNIRRDFILASGAQMILPDLERHMYRPTESSRQNDTAHKTIVGFHGILKDARTRLESHLGDTLRSPLQPLDITTPGQLPLLEDLELMALSRRAELRMEVGTDYDPAQLRHDAMRTLPGVAKMLSARQPEANWVQFAQAYSQSLIRVFTLPLQMRDDNTRTAMTRLRHHALTGAILAQVHLAHHDYTQALSHHQTALNILKTIEDSPQINDADWINAQAALVVTTAHLQTARADLALVTGLTQAGGREKPEDLFVLQEANFQKIPQGIFAHLPAIPFVQKISGRDGATPSKATKPVSESAFLTLPSQKIMTLLHAPISDP